MTLYVVSVLATLVQSDVVRLNVDHHQLVRPTNRRAGDPPTAHCNTPDGRVVDPVAGVKDAMDGEQRSRTGVVARRLEVPVDRVL